jgi:hypothetical protein
MPTRKHRSALLSLALASFLPALAFPQAVNQSSSDAASQFFEAIDQAANREISSYYSGGGKTGLPTHPATRWAAILFEFSQINPASPALTEAIRRPCGCSSTVD